MALAARLLREAMTQAQRDYAAARPWVWFPKWTGLTCVLVAAGPSAKAVDLEAGRGRARFIAINNSVQLCPWADVLYACDANWWEQNNGAPNFQGLRISQDKRAASLYSKVRRVISVRGADRILTDHPGLIGWGGNGGFQAINLAVQFGCTRLILVGYDMTLAGGTHWHGDHVGKCSNPNDRNVERWRRVTDEAAGDLTARGIKVFNCSPVSALQNYPKMSFEAALDG